MKLNIIKLKNAPLLIIDGDRSNNYPKFSEFQKQGYCLFLNSNSINENKLNLDNSVYISQEKYNSITKGRVEFNDIVFTTRGSNLGKVALFNIKDFKALFNAQMLLIRTEPEKLDSEYLYFQMISEEFQSNIKRLISGSAQPQLPIKDLKEISIYLPSIEHQKKVVEICKSIENKVNVLQYQNKLLLKLITLKFDDWFIYNKECKLSNFKEIINCEINTKIKSQAISDFTVLSAVSSGELIPSDEFFNKQVYSKDISNYKIVEKFDFAYNPARVNIGSIGMLDKDIKGCVSPVYTVFRTKPGWHYFVDLLIKQPHIRKTIEVYCSGSVRQVLKFSDFCRIEIKLPLEELVFKFNEVYQSVLDKINHNKRQIESLTKLRDTILPRLMSGKIEIKD